MSDRFSTGVPGATVGSPPLGRGGGQAPQEVMEGTGILRSSSLAELAQALAKAQAELKNPPKDRVNPHYKSKYADLATIRDTVLPVLNKYGLSVVQLPCELPGNEQVPTRVGLWTLLLHESGEYLGSCIPLRPVKDDPQGMGSALTYARRYALQAIAGVAGEEDDDGESASGNTPRVRRGVDRREEGRRRMLDYFLKTHGISAAQVCQVVGVQRPEQIEEVHLRRLREIAVALKGGQPVSVYFPPSSEATAALAPARLPAA